MSTGRFIDPRMAVFRLDREHIVARAATVVFGERLVPVSYRAILVAAMVEAALPETWRWCPEEKGLRRFRHHDGTCLAVVLAAAGAGGSVGREIFGGASAGRTEKRTDIYVFADHVTIGSEADHREPAQWRFYVFTREDLAVYWQQSRAASKPHWKPDTWWSLADAVDRAWQSLGFRRLGRTG